MRQMIAACAAAALLWPASADANPSEEMAQQIAGALRDSGQLSDYRVGVRYQDGVAWLLGSVTDDQQSAAAEQIAAQVDGVDRVINKITVEGPAQNKPILEAQPISTSETPEPPQPSSVEQPSSAQQADMLLAMMEREQATPQPFSPEQNAAPAPLNHVQQRAPQRIARRNMPRPMRRSGPPRQQVRQANAYMGGPAGGGYGGGGGMPTPQGYTTGGAAGVSYDQANMPGYAWPSYAAYPNYSAVTYPQQYSPSAWPYIGPFYPYPQVPLGWRKVTLEWDDGWWFLDFSHQKGH